MSDDDPDLPFVETSETDDVIAGRDRRRRVPLWWLAALVVVAIGVAVGYQVGRHGRAALRATTTLTVTAPGPTFTVLPPAVLLGPGGRCFAQVGTRLVLGVQAQNTTARTLTLGNVEANLPLGGLRVVHTELSQCGSGGRRPVAGYQLAVHGFVWVSVTFDVLVRCPAALPVRFQLTYSANDGGGTDDIGGFNDLGEVPYSGCPR